MWAGSAAGVRTAVEPAGGEQGRDLELGMDTCCNGKHARIRRRGRHSRQAAAAAAAAAVICVTAAGSTCAFPRAPTMLPCGRSCIT
eukprot:1037617-Pelagomonas_calceolata.AAC.1